MIQITMQAFLNYLFIFLKSLILLAILRIFEIDELSYAHVIHDYLFKYTFLLYKSQQIKIKNRAYFN